MFAFSRKCISVNYHKATLLQSSACADFLCHDKNSNKYDKDLEMDIHPVVKECANYKCIEEQTESNSVKIKESH